MILVNQTSRYRHVLRSGLDTSTGADTFNHHGDTNEHSDHHGSYVPSLYSLKQDLEQNFQNMDRDKDGALSYTDNAENFISADTDANGLMDFSEYTQYFHHDYASMQMDDSSLRVLFALLDTGVDTRRGDGYISRDDFLYFFHGLDLNGDGQVTQAEFDEGIGMMAYHIAQILREVYYGSSGSHSQDHSGDHH